MERVSLKEKMLKEGKFLIDNTFTTDRGIYRVRIILFGGNLFFHKMKNGEIVEVQNINKLVNKQGVKNEEKRKHHIVNNFCYCVCFGKLCIRKCIC